MQHKYPNFDIEKQLNGIAVGVDEAGRGPLAGPVVAAAVIVNDEELLLRIKDSKMLSKQNREILFNEIIVRYPYSIVEISAKQIDKVNILQATMLAMRKAIEDIKHNFDSVLIDGNKTPLKRKNFYPIINGDSKSISIAAASILAKVYRDKLMAKLHLKYPYYKWDKNVGYGTKEHYKAISQYGITPYHRKSFSLDYQLKSRMI